jgi:protein ImuB
MSLPGKHRVPPEVSPSPASGRSRLRPALGGGNRSGTGEPARSAAPAGELWLAIHLPNCILESLCESAAAASEAAAGADAGHVVIVDPGRGGKVVCACGVTATAAGVAPGMALNSALALLPDARVRARDSRRERTLLEAVAIMALDFTPRVNLDPPDGVLLEVRGSLRLFGGVRQLCARVGERLRARGLAPRIALTPTRLASLWFARSGMEVVLRRPEALAGRLTALPLACTRWPERSLRSLATMGVRAVGDCLRLPRDGFTRRFELQMRLDLDRALGHAPDPRAAFVPGERFAARRDLEPELADTARLQRACEPLLDELCTFLQARGASVESLELRFLHRDAPPTRLRLRFAEPVTAVVRIAALLRERLARAEWPEPVRSVRLRSGPLSEARAQAGDLFALDRQRASAVPQLVERLRARLGEEAVHGLCLVPEHRPESAWEKGDILLFQKTGKGECPLFPPFFTGILRPLWLLTEPQRLDGEEQPRYQGALELEEGPERIESGWWDGRDVRRDYYVARTPAGVRVWIFRERRTPGGWFLHGVFG